MLSENKGEVLICNPLLFTGRKLRLPGIGIEATALFPHCGLYSKILPVFSENCIFWTGTSFFYHSFVSTAKWHITSLVYRQCSAL